MKPGGLDRAARWLRRCHIAIIRWEQLLCSYRLWLFLRALKREVESDDLFGLAAEMAYRFLFAIFPLIIFLVASMGFLNDFLGLNNRIDQIVEEVDGVFPHQVAEIIDRYVTELLMNRSATLLTMGLIGSYWGAAGGVGALIKGLERVYGIYNRRPFWKRQLVAMIVTAILPVTALGLFTSAVLGRLLIVEWGRQLGIGQFAIDLISAIRWPILVFVLFISLSMVYHMLPNHRFRYLHSLPGSVFATAGWLILTNCFGLYVANFGNYDRTYGSFGAAAAFLLWLYLVDMVVLLGAEINTLLEPRRRRQWLNVGRSS